MDTKRLRQRVLDLAIHGKLVPQNPQDEPASELLKRIAAEKERLVKEGKIKQSKKKDNEDIDEVPFEVPQGWVWTKINNICEVVRGGSPRPAGSDIYYNGTIPFMKVADITKDENMFVYSAKNTIKEAGLSKTRMIEKETFVLSNSGATLGIPKITKFKTTINDGIAAFLYLDKNIQKYCYYFFKSKTNDLRNIDQGAAQPNLNTDLIKNIQIPLPPLAEQHRIVSEVEKYFFLIDILEESENDLQQSIQKAKSKILDLAIKGKLVEKKDEWEEKKLGDICNYGKCITVNVENIAPDSWVLELEDIEKDTARIQNRISRQEREIKGTRHAFQKGDVLYSKLRTYLNKVLVAKEDGFCTTEIIPIKPNECITAEFLCHMMRSKYFIDYTVQCGYGVKMPRLSTNDAQKAIIPVPPLAEQHRIVAKIEELFTQLDNIAEALK